MKSRCRACGTFPTGIRQTTLIKDMQSDVRNGNTVLTFPLSEKPGECNVVQRNRRTISIVIR